jgi:hypothetical protein
MNVIKVVNNRNAAIQSKITSRSIPISLIPEERSGGGLPNPDVEDSIGSLKAE